MRSTTIPAQVTTVEDKVAGELSFKQLILLIIPLIGSGAIFAFLPSNTTSMKVVIIVCLFTLFGFLAIRVKGKIILEWILIVSSYAFRPRYYVYDKNNSTLRNLPKDIEQTVAVESKKKNVAKISTAPKLSAADLVEVQNLIANPNAKLQFKTDKKGALSVHFTEV